MKFSSILAACSLLPALLVAHPIKWTATGTVTEVTAAGYPEVAASDPVEVAFSYDSDAHVNGLSALPFGNGIFNYKAEFSDDLDLKMSVKIGGQTWEGMLPFSPRGGIHALHSLSWDGGGSPDTLTLKLDLTDGATFPGFPYTGTNAPRNIELVLTDTLQPCAFLNQQSLPGGSTQVSQITAATGLVSAGTDRIRFALDLASIEVVEEEPKIPITLTKTITGIELKWFGEPGVFYQLFESDDMSEWEDMTIHEGLDSDIVVPLEPFELHPKRRFYKVIEL